MYQDQIQRLGKVQIDPNDIASSLEAMRREIINTFQSCQPLTQRGTTLFTRNSEGQPTVEIKNALGPALRINGEVEYGDSAANAFVIEGTINAALATTDPTVGGTVTKYTMGKNPGATVTLVNPASGHGGTDYVFYGDDDSWFLAYWNAEDEAYRIANMECPA